MGVDGTSKPSRTRCMTMPTYEVFIDGKPRKVEVTRAKDGSLAVKVDDKPIKAEFSASEFNSEKQLPIRINGKTYRVELPKIDRERTFPIKVEEVSFKAEIKPFTVKPSLTAVEPKPAALTKRANASKQVIRGAVTSPMTGKILSVKVKKGDRVKAGQVVCMIEAMKMENEITASEGGTVQEVRVSEGSSVSEGEVLLVIA